MNLFYELLQVSLGTRSSLSVNPTKQEWFDVFSEVDYQGLLGVMFVGVERTIKYAGGLQNTNLDPDLFASWYSYLHKIEEKNKEINKNSVWIQQWMVKEGFNSCILKGQGNALLYPTPSLRTSGDIDIWMWAKQFDERNDKKYYGSDNRQFIIDWVKRKMNGKQIEATIHHVQLEPLNGVDVEGHYWPSYFFNFSRMRKFERWCEKEHLRQMNNWKELQDVEGKISVPTTDFNLIFQLSHIKSHVLFEGISIRQLLDYYWTLNAGDYDKDAVVKTIKSFGLYGIASGIMWVLKYNFNMPDDKLLMPANKKKGEIILKSVEQDSFIGKNNDESSEGKENSKLKTFILHINSNLKKLSLCPLEILSEPLFRVWHYFWIRKARK